MTAKDGRQELGIFYYKVLNTTHGASRWLSGKEPACQCRRCKFDPCLGQEEPLEKEMATHPSIVSWRIPWTKETGRLWGCKELDTTE